MTAADYQAAQQWIRELEGQSFKKDCAGIAALARHTDEAREAERRCALLKRLLKELRTNPE